MVMYLKVKIKIWAQTYPTYGWTHNFTFPIYIKPNIFHSCKQ